MYDVIAMLEITISNLRRSDAHKRDAQITAELEETLNAALEAAKFLDKKAPK